MVEENSEFKIGESTVKNVVSEFKTKTTKVLIEDEKLRDMVRDNLHNIIKCANDNLDVLENIRKKVLDKLDVADNSDERLLLTYLREISGSVRTQNDTIRTLNVLLESMKDTTKETEVTSVSDISKTVSILKNLEKDGFIQILPAYFNSELFKAENKIAEKRAKEENEEALLLN